jgi:hypothetical protein
MRARRIVNYVSASQLGPGVGNGTAFGVQLYELGSSLALATGVNLAINLARYWDQSQNSFGYALQECVLGQGNGFFTHYVQ